MAHAWAGTGDHGEHVYNSRRPRPSSRARRGRPPRAGPSRQLDRSDGTRPCDLNRHVSNDLGQPSTPSSGPVRSPPRRDGAARRPGRGRPRPTRRDGMTCGGGAARPGTARPGLASASLRLRWGRCRRRASRHERGLALTRRACSQSWPVRWSRRPRRRARARQVLARATADVPREAVVAFVAAYFDLGWLLDADATRDGADARSGRLRPRTVPPGLRARPGLWGQGDSVRSRAWGESAARGVRLTARTVRPTAAARLARTRAGVCGDTGREALAEAERGLALWAPTAAGRESVNYAYLNYVAARTALRG